MINSEITEDQLYDAFYAIQAVQKQKGHTSESAMRTANLLVYSVFRNLITYDSLIYYICNNARKAFCIEGIKNGAQ